MNMELDKLTKLYVVDQIKSFMDSFAGDKEWLFLCQCQSSEICESEGSDIGLKFIEEMSILTGFSDYIGMASGKAMGGDSKCQKNHQSRKRVKKDIVKRQSLDTTAGVAKDTGLPQNKRRKRMINTIIKDSVRKNNNKTRHNESNEKIFNHEIKVEMEPGEYEKLQVEEMVANHSDENVDDGVSDSDHDEVLGFESLKQTSNQEQNQVKTESNEVHESAADMEQSSELENSALEINQPASEIHDNQSTATMNQCKADIDNSASKAITVSHIDQSAMEMNQSASNIHNLKSDIDANSSELILNKSGNVQSESKEKEKHKQSVSENLSTKTRKRKEAKTEAKNKKTHQDSSSDNSCFKTDKTKGIKTKENETVLPHNEDQQQGSVLEDVVSETDQMTNITKEEDDMKTEISLETEYFNGQNFELIGEFSCTECFKTFKSSTALRGHQNAHRKDEMILIKKVGTESSKFKCNKCGATFWTAIQLQRHASRTRTCLNTEILLRVNLPPEVVTYKDRSSGEEIKTTVLDLVKSVRSEKASSKPSCLICEKTFKKRIHLENHIFMLHSNHKPHVCEFCQKSFKMESNMNLHKKSMHKDLLKCVTCDLCGVNCLTQEKLDSHKVMSCPKRSRNFKCEICKYNTNRKTHFDQHMRSHTTTERDKFTCPVCSKVLSSNSALNNHVQAVHSTDAPFKCAICGTTFKTRQHAKIHQMRVHGKPNYTCDICNKSFTFVSYFNTHMQCHLDQRDFICEICGRSFFKKSVLLVHQQTHSTGVKKALQCSKCDSTFSRIAYLRRHEATHNPAIYICEICGMTFRLLTKLQIHRKQHSETYTKEHYTCKSCGKYCGTVTRYKTLIARYHPETIPMMESTSQLRFHKCHLCPRLFNYGGTLKKHLKVHNQKSMCCPKCFHLFSTDQELETHMKKRHRPKKTVGKPKVDKTEDVNVVKQDSKSQKRAALKSVKSQKKTKLKSKIKPKNVEKNSKIQNSSLKLQSKVQKSDSQSLPQNHLLHLQPMQQNLSQLQLIQADPLQLQQKLAPQNDKEYIAVKASNFADHQNLLPYVGSDMAGQALPQVNNAGQVLPLVNNLMVAAFIRDNNVEASEAYAKLISPPFFPNL